jgi:hypothetical protein
VGQAVSTQVTTPFPSVLETAKRLGVSKHDAMVLSELAERSQESGIFAIPGLGRLVRGNRKASVAAARKGVKSRVAKSATDAIVPSKTK